MFAGLKLITPTSTAVTGSGSSATINANGSVTFSSCATLSLNGVFGSTYDDYTVVVRHTASSSGTWVVSTRLRLSGTDNSTASSYTYQRLDADSTTISAGRASDSLAYNFSATNGGRDGAVIHFYGPAIAQPTAARSLHVSSYASAWIADYAWTHNQSVAYDGFSFIAYSGTISGLVCVYGMRK